MNEHGDQSLIGHISSIISQQWYWAVVVPNTSACMHAVVVPSMLACVNKESMILLEHSINLNTTVAMVPPCIVLVQGTACTVVPSMHFRKALDSPSSDCKRERREQRNGAATRRVSIVYAGFSQWT